MAKRPIEGENSQSKRFATTPSILFKKISSHQTDYSARFKRTEYLATFEISHNIESLSELQESSNALTSAFINAIRPFRDSAGPYDIFSFYLIHNSFSTPCWISPQRNNEFDNNCFINALGNITQSNTNFLFNGLLRIQINITKHLYASGRHRSQSNVPQTYSQYQARKKSRCAIDHTEGCGYIALALAMEHYQLQSDSDYRYKWFRITRRDRPSSFNQRVQMGQSLAASIGKNFLEPVTTLDMMDFKNKTGFSVVWMDSRTETRIFNTPIENPNKVLYLEFEENQDENQPGHLNVITSITGYLDTSYYCSFCHQCYFHPYEHICENTCEFCRHQPKCKGNENKECFNCKVTFVSNQCFDNHRKSRHNISVCTKFSKCDRCGTVDSRNHNCNGISGGNRQRKCHRCKEIIRQLPHFCTMTVLDNDKLQEEDDRNKIICCFDIEAAFSEESPQKFRHTANLLISRTCCDNCYNYDTNEKEQDCEICGQLEHIFVGTGCVKEFGHYLYNDLSIRADEHHLSIIVLAHNARGYDNKYIIRDLFGRDFRDIDLMMNGLKILKIEIGNIRFIDSLSIFQQGLASLPKAFGLTDIGKKHFPYKFNVEDNWNYDGLMPSLEFWDVDHMKEGPRAEFLVWFEEHKNNHFNLQEELISYCKSDVEILLKAVQVFRKTFKLLTNIDPIARKFTLAGIGLEFFRAKVLKENEIGITPVKGYSSDRKRSIRAMIWIDWLESEKKIHIVREKKIGKYYVDGYCEENNTIYEYYGCKWHGHDCVRGYPNNRHMGQQNPKGEVITPDQLFETTARRERELREMGYIVEYTWECIQEELKLTDGSYCNFYKERYPMNKYLKDFGGVNIRDSFFGGRTENFKFVADISNDLEAKILYYDFRSLYPYVLKYFDYPLGHPIVITNSFKDIKEYFGFIKCKIVPPPEMYVPILPVRRDNKLIFPLCNACSNEKKSSCYHTIEERALVGTWTTVELQNAIENGYYILKIYEIYHYPRKSNELFKMYIDKFLKIKQESDGYPLWVQNDRDKQKYIDDFRENNNIDLDPEKIEKNPALRFIAKLFLNTLWGKLAQRNNLPQTKVLRDRASYEKLLNDTTKVITGEYMPNDRYLVVNFKEKEECKAYQGNTSVAIASFVTSYARTVLYKKLKSIDRRDLFYCDTDSIIFKWKPGQIKPETGDNLGELCDEIEKDYGNGARCTKFVSLGPKVYGLEIEKPDKSTKCIMKIKGITLTHRALDVVNFDKMVELATSHVKGDHKSVEVDQLQIKSDKHHTLYTCYAGKEIQTVFEKRCVIPPSECEVHIANSLVTLPFGFFFRYV